MDVIGLEGELKYGYQTAAKVGKWTMNPMNPTLMSFKGVILSYDEYWLTQTPLELVVRVGRTRWRWPDVTVTKDGQTLHANLVGKPEVTPW